MHQNLTQRWNRNYQKCPKKGAGSFGEIYKMIQKPQKWPFIWSSRCLRDAVEIFRFLLNQKTPFHTVIQMNSKMLILSIKFTPLCLSRHKLRFFILKMPLMERILIGQLKFGLILEFIWSNVLRWDVIVQA